MLSTRVMFGASRKLILSAGLACAASSGAWAIDVPEAEPNDTKPTAQSVTLANGDAIAGAASGAGATDYFRVRTSAAPLRIYKHQLQLNTFQPFTVHLRGRLQSSGVINAASDTFFQLGLNNASLTQSDKRVQWYGFGRQEEITYYLQGNGSTLTPYRAVLTSTPITPVDLGSMPPGGIAIVPDPATAAAYDTDWYVFDQNFNPVAGLSRDEPDGGAVTAGLAPGVYYIAGGRANTANDQPAAASDSNRSSPVLDYPNAIACSRDTITAADYGIVVSNVVTGTTLVGAWTPTLDSFDIAWFKFTVGAPSTPPSVTPSATPASVARGTPTLIAASVAPGQNPTSTAIQVVADLSPLGGPASQPLRDDGANGDATAGDGVFSVLYSVPGTGPTGVRTIVVTATDGQGRTGGSPLDILITPALPASVDFPELEFNDSKASATAAPMTPGQWLGGFSQGDNVFEPGILDYFLVETPATPTDIYRYELVLTTPGPAGHQTVIRGLDQNGQGVIQPGSDVNLQDGIIRADQTRLNAWYGFGRAESVYYRVNGTTPTTERYAAQLTRTVAPRQTLTPLPAPGRLTIQTTAANDTEIVVYDADTLTPVPGFSNDGIAGGGFGARLTRDFPAGRYLLAIAHFNLANDQPTPPDDSFRAQFVCDDADTVVSSYGGISPTNVSFVIREGDATGPIVRTFNASQTQPFEITWVALTVAGAQCVADFDDGSGTGVPDGGVGIEDLLYYIGLYDAGVVRADVDNGTSTGTPDGGVGIEDLLYYLRRYESGC